PVIKPFPVVLVYKLSNPRLPRPYLRPGLSAGLFGDGHRLPQLPFADLTLHVALLYPFLVALGAPGLPHRLRQSRDVRPETVPAVGMEKPHRHRLVNRRIARRATRQTEHPAFPWGA